jgi:hypothetical protein
MSPRTTTEASGVPVAVRVLSVPAVVVLLLTGGWVAGGQITDDYALSMLLTAGWVGLVGVAALATFLKRREMWPALVAFTVTALVAGGYLASETLVDDRIDEDVVTAAPARAGARPAPGTNELLARGRFESLAHETEGVAQVIELPDGRRMLTLTGFETDNGPDLRVYLSSADSDQGSAGEDFEDLGELKGNVGDQQYEIPAGVDIDTLTKVVVWCRAFSVGFGAASLREF